MDGTLQVKYADGSFDMINLNYIDTISMIEPNGSRASLIFHYHGRGTAEYYNEDAKLLAEVIKDMGSRARYAGAWPRFTIVNLGKIGGEAAAVIKDKPKCICGHEQELHAGGMDCQACTCGLYQQDVIVAKLREKKCICGHAKIDHPFGRCAGCTCTGFEEAAE